MTNSVSKKEIVLQRTKAFAALLCLLFFFIIKAEGQTTYDWDNAAPDGNWRRGVNNGPRWNPGNYWDEPPFGILRFNNNHQLTMNNNVPGTYSQHQIVFGSANTLARTISGNTVQLFEFALTSTWPLIVNQSSATHTISFPLIASSNAGFNLELIANAGPLIFSGTINNNARNLMIYGNNSVLDGTNRFIRLAGIVSNTGGLTITQAGVARLNAVHTYSGSTQIDNGELWIESSGSINSSAVAVGNAGQQGNTAKIWIETAGGGTTFSNSLTINQGNTGTREIGGLNTSGTNTFSGNITNNSSNGLNLRSLNTGAVTNFTGEISQANPISIVGAGIVQVSGNNTYTGTTTIQSGATLRLGAAGSGANTPLGTTAAGTTVNTGGVLDLNGFSLATTEALTLNGTGIASGGALINSSATAVTYSGTIALASASSINTTGNITASGIISGGNAFTKIGNGTLILSAANTYSGGTTINAGTVQLSGLADRLPVTGAVTLANTAGAVLDLNSLNQTIGSLSGGGAIGGNLTLGNGSLTTGNASNTTYSGIISGTGGLTKEGTGTFTLAAANTFTGSININTGVLRLNTATAVPSTNSIFINGSAGLTFGSGVSGNVALGFTQCTSNSGTPPSINFESSASAVNVTFSSFAMLGSSRLTITGWTPTGNKRIYIIGGMPTVELDRIDFDGYGLGAKTVLVSGSTFELLPKFFYVTQASGVFNDGGTNAAWVNNDKPNFNDGTATILVQTGHVLTLNETFNFLKVEVVGTLVMNGTNSFTTAATATGGIANTGTITMVSGSTITIGAGGTFTNSGALNTVAGSIVNMNTGTTWAGNGTIGTNGTINFLGTGTITGTVTFPNVNISGDAVNFGTAATINGSSSLTISGSGSVNTNAPSYAAGSTLIYNRTITRGAEWTTGTSGRGVPHHVQVNNTYTVTLGDGSTAFRQCNGNLTLSGALTMGAMTEDLIVAGNVLINSTGTLTLGSIVGAIAGDIFVGADWQQNTLATFNPNQRAVIFNGASTAVQNITAQDGLESFGYLIVNKSNDGTVRFASGTNAEVNGTNSGFPLQLLNGNLDLNGNTFTFRTYNTTLHDILIDRINPASSLTRNISNSSGTTANFIFTHADGTNRTATITRNNLGVASLLSFASNIVVQIGRTGSANSGVNFGAGITTINGTLQINTGGFVITNAPTYATNSLLQYNAGGNYNRTTEWSATSGPGYPFNVRVSNNTSFFPGGTTAPTDFRNIALNLVNDLTIDAGSRFDMSGGTATMTLPLIVGRDIIITGNLDGSTNSGSGIQVGRNWTRNTGGTFTHNTRAVTFNTAQNSNLTAPVGGETFHVLVMNKSAASNTLTLQSQLIILNSVTFTTGVVVASFPGNLLVMNAGSSYTGASTSSFVHGPMKKIGNTAFDFPVGKRVNSTNHYRYIGLGAGGAVDDDFIAEFHRQSSTVRGWISPAAATLGLQRVSYCEHWFLRRMVGSTQRSVTLTWTNQSPCNTTYVTNVNTLRVVPYGGSGWGDDFGGTSGSPENPGPGITSTITYTTPGNYLFFTLGSTNLNDNPLPFTLLSFNGRNRTKDIELNFSVKGNDEQQHYLVERSADGRNFSPLIKITAAQNRSEADYNTLDEQPVNGWNYYRVTAVDFNRQSRQSQIIRVWFGNRAGNPSIYPNPVQGGNVQLFTGGMPKGMYNVQVMGVDGKIMLSRNWQFDGIQPLYNLSVPQLPAGMYYLVLRGENQPPVQLKFVK